VDEWVGKIGWAVPTFHETWDILRYR